jgi:glycosyltransferase involved in cell wall biosynthesis
MNGLPVSPEEERTFIGEMINSPDLYRYIKEHKEDFNFFLFIPYMFGTTFHGVLACPEKAVIIPCLHDESYAHMSIYREMFSSARGLVFLSDAEHVLANRLYDLGGIPSQTLGGGIDTSFKGEGDRFRKKYGIDSPFLLYAGRKEEGKNTPLLIDYFRRYCDAKQTDLKLIMLGPGKAAIPAGSEGRIIDLGFVPPQDKYDACAAAACFCNPSVNESFSIVIMESWLCEVPVLVHAACDVTREHCIKSNAGLYFRDYDEFEACVDLYLDDSSLRKKMGSKGRTYVLENFSWDAVVKRFEDFFRSLEEA